MSHLYGSPVLGCWCCSSPVETLCRSAQVYWGPHCQNRKTTETNSGMLRTAFSNPLGHYLKEVGGIVFSVRRTRKVPSLLSPARFRKPV